MSTPAFAQPGFTADQQKVLAALAKGATITAAAQSVAVHRTSIHHWSRVNPLFREAVENARAAYRAGIQCEYEALADAALATVKGILNDPKVSAGVRLKAALAVLKNVAAEPAPAQPPRPVVVAPEPTDAEIHADLTRIEQSLGLSPAPLPQPSSTPFNFTQRTVTQ